MTATNHKLLSTDGFETKSTMSKTNYHDGKGNHWNRMKTDYPDYFK